ncbi:hypothetical protein D3C75_1087440 [compost metagenome]
MPFFLAMNDFRVVRSVYTSKRTLGPASTSAFGLAFIPACLAAKAVMASSRVLPTASSFGQLLSADFSGLPSTTHFVTSFSPR